MKGSNAPRSVPPIRYPYNNLVRRCCNLPVPPLKQLSIEEFLMNPNDPYDKDHELLLNPLSAEFGVRTAKGMETLIQDTLPDFKLVRM